MPLSRMCVRRGAASAFLLAWAGALPPASRALSAQDTGRVARTVQRIDRRQLERVLGAGASEKLKLVRPQAAPSPVPARESTVALKPGEFLFSKVAAHPVRVELPVVSHPDRAPASVPPPPAHVPPSAVPGTKTALTPATTAAPKRITYILPYRWITTDAQGQMRVLRPVVDLEGGGLVYDPGKRDYRGAALIGVEDSLHPELGTQPLPTPLRMQLLLTRPGHVKPTAVALSHTSLDYTRVAIDASQASSLEMRVRTAADTGGVLVPLPVFGPQVKLTVLPNAIQAFGLATATVSIALPPGIPPGQRLTIHFTSPDVLVRPALLVVSADSTNTASIRSGFPGTHVIGAEVDGMPAGEQPVTFVWPWLFLSAMLIGVLVGAALRVFAAKRRSRATRFSRVVVAAFPFGLVTAVAAQVGLDLLQMKLEDPGTWAGVMLTAAIGGYLGPAVLKQFTGEKAAPG